jgi:hypothetical protein
MTAKKSKVKSAEIKVKIKAKGSPVQVKNALSKIVKK